MQDLRIENLRRLHIPDLFARRFACDDIIVIRKLYRILARNCRNTRSGFFNSFKAPSDDLIIEKRSGPVVHEYYLGRSGKCFAFLFSFEDCLYTVGHGKVSFLPALYYHTDLIETVSAYEFPDLCHVFLTGNEYDIIYKVRLLNRIQTVPDERFSPELEELFMHAGAHSCSPASGKEYESISFTAHTLNTPFLSPIDRLGTALRSSPLL